MAQQEPDTSEFLRTNSLPLLRSPIVPGKNRSPASTFRREPTAPDLEDFGYRDGPASGEVPEFERHQEATAIEVFYDLFFAANLTVFSEGQNITSPDKLATFVVYFSLLWFNWVLLGCFDVRFITDSMFERCARAVHFGVMVGFAVICPSLSLVTQVPSTYQTLSLILMTSRLTMALQYASIWWYCRQYKNTKLPLGIMVGLNVVSGFVFLGVAFAFNGSNKALYSIWLVITAIEAIVTVGLSLKWEVLSFQGTHLAPRISLLTFILMGEGIAIVCVSVVRIVTNANAWSESLSLV
jgi:low temperature requirement protein LtrA